MTEQQKPIAYATINEDCDYAMLFFDEQEARLYSGDDEPIPLGVIAALPASEQKPVALEWIEPERGMCISHSEPPEYGVYQVKPPYAHPDPDSAARINELEAEVKELNFALDVQQCALAKRIRNPDIETAIARQEADADSYWNARERLVNRIEQLSRQKDMAESFLRTAVESNEALKEKLRVAREAINYCVKQVPELATVPCMTEALATIGEEDEITLGS